MHVHRELEVDLRALGHKGDAYVALGVAAVQGNATAARLQDTGDHLEQGALAGAVGANHGDALPGGYDERHLVQSDRAVVAHRQPLGRNAGGRVVMLVVLLSQALNHRCCPRLPSAGRPQ